MVVLAAAAGLLAACGNGSNGPRPAVVEPPGTFIVQGRVTVLDDTGGRAEGGRGSVLAVTVDQAPAMWAAGTRRPPSAADLRYADSSFPPGALPGLVAAIAPLRNGRFELHLAEATYLLCLADGDRPTRVTGCVEVPINGHLDLDLTTGEGGLRLRRS